MSHSIPRRSFLAGSLVAATCAPLRTTASATEQTSGGSGFFTLAQRGGRWWLIAPDDEPFFSLGLNHIDPSPLRYPANGDLWQRKYGNSMERWLKESVAPDLRQWGFNSVGSTSGSGSWARSTRRTNWTNHARRSCRRRSSS